MMRGDLGRDRQTFGLCLADRVHRAAGTDMSDMHPSAGEARQGNIAGDHDIFGDAWDAANSQAHRGRPLIHAASAREVQVFFMHTDRHVKHQAVFQGAAHQVGIHNRAAVV